MGPDEPRYAAVARDMAATGDWVTPRLNGQPWFEKPILYYWMAAALFRVLGGQEWPARLPSALAGLVASLAVAWMAWRHYGAATAWVALLVFSTSLATVAFGRAATPDMAFSTALTLAMASAAGVLQRAGCFGRPVDRQDSSIRVQPFGQAALGLCLGIATLAKGPAALLLAGGSVGLWALAARGWKKILRLVHPLALIAFCALALPWYVLCAIRNPGFVQTFLFLHNFERYLTPVFHHRQPFWFFGPILLLGLLPWTALLAGVVGDALRRWREKSWKDSPGLFFASWAVFPFVFFSFSQSKLPGYILPTIPPLALLLAATFTRALNLSSSAARWLCASIGFSWVALGVSAGYWSRKLPPDAALTFSGQISKLALGVAVAGLAIAAFSLYNRPWVALTLSSLLVAALIEVANLSLLPRLDPYLSARRTAASLEAPAGAVRTVVAFRLQRSWKYGLDFYWGREIPEWRPEIARPVLVVTSAAGLAELERIERTRVLPGGVSQEALLVQVETEAR